MGIRDSSKIFKVNTSYLTSVLDTIEKTILSYDSIYKYFITGYEEYKSSGQLTEDNMYFKGMVHLRSLPTCYPQFKNVSDQEIVEHCERKFSIIDNMKANGFSEDCPISMLVLRKKENVFSINMDGRLYHFREMDGYHRLCAAMYLGLEYVYVVVREFRPTDYRHDYILTELETMLTESKHIYRHTKYFAYILGNKEGRSVSSHIAVIGQSDRKVLALAFLLPDVVKALGIYAFVQDVKKANLIHRTLGKFVDNLHIIAYDWPENNEHKPNYNITICSDNDLETVKLLDHLHTKSIVFCSPIERFDTTQIGNLYFYPETIV